MLSQKKAGSIVGLVALLAAAAFLILGFTIGNWHLIWLVFLAIPITAIITDILSKKKDASGLVTGLTALLATVAYMIMGFVFDLWHPGWIVFLTIPISSVIVSLVKKETDDENPDSQEEAPKD